MSTSIYPSKLDFLDIQQRKFNLFYNFQVLSFHIPVKIRLGALAVLYSSPNIWLHFLIQTVEFNLFIFLTDRFLCYMASEYGVQMTEDRRQMTENLCLISQIRGGGKII